MKKLLSLTVLLCGPLLTVQAADIYKIDAVHSSISFKVRDFVVDVNGSFRKFEGTITVDREHPEKSTVTATIDVASVDTKSERRDADLRSADFFNVAKYPAITFQSKNVKQTGSDSGDIVGDLTIHGVTREVTLHVKFIGKDKDARLVSSWQVTTDPVKRSEYGLIWSKAIQGTALVGEEVRIAIEIEADKVP